MPASTNASRLGQVNGAGDVDALFLRQFAGEVLVAFQDTQVMMDKHLVRTITEGKSATFPATGTAAAARYVPGDNILDNSNGYLNNINHNEREIFIDDPLIAPVFVNQIDQLKNHFDSRSIYTRECGEALANEFDTDAFRVLVLAARGSATVTGGDAGTQLKKGKTVATDPRVLAKAIGEGVRNLKEKKTSRSATIYCALRPEQYQMLTQDEKLLDKDVGGVGSISEGRMPRVQGAWIVESNNVPNTDASGESTTGENNTYTGDFSDTIATIWVRDAIGTVKLLDLNLEVDYKSEYQGWLIIAKYALGTGILRPERAVEISQAAA